MRTSFGIYRGTDSFKVYNQVGAELSVASDGEVQRFDGSKLVGDPEYPQDATQLLLIMAEFLGYEISQPVRTPSSELGS